VRVGLAPHWLWISQLNSSPPGRGAKYCDQRVGLSVCPLAYLKDHDRVQLASDYLSKNFPLRGCPINPNEAEFFSA